LIVLERGTVVADGPTMDILAQKKTAPLVSTREMTS